MSNKVDRSRRQRLHWVVALALLLGLVGPGAVGAQPATPASGDGATNQVLRDLLRLAPDLAAAGGPASGELASFANVATQLAALGISQPTSPDELSGDYRQATAGLLWPPGTLRSALAPEWSITFGFDLSQIDSALTVGQPPETITIVRGRFDRAALIAAWEQSGYTEVPANQPETTVYSLAEEPEVMFDSLVGRLALASLNNAVILADGTLAFSGSLDRVEAVAGRPVVRVELAYGAGVPSQTWIGLLFARDLGFVAW